MSNLPFVLVLVTLLMCEVTDSSNQCPNVKTSLGSIRKRRHLTFPDGSNMVLTISLVKAFMTHAPSGWNIALEIDVAYPLPNANFTNAHFRRKLHHRQKREFWDRMETALDFHNLNGRACVLRSICEAETYLAVPGKSLVHDILKALFKAPVHDAEFAEEVGGAYNELLDPHFCERTEDCPFSLLHFVLALNRQKAPVHDAEFAEEVGGAYNELLDPHFCERTEDCPFSLLHFVLALNRQKY